jgi:hypothetical protein
MTIRSGLRCMTRASIVGIAGVFGSTSFAAMDCGALTSLKIPGTQLEIIKAEEISSGAAHCRVDGMLDRRVGQGGKPYGIGFAVALPREWNGRFLFQGGGGLNGSVRPPLGDVAAGETSALARGFAVVSTDSGHSAEVFDSSFLADQEATINFLYQAVAQVTVVAKQIVAAHYGRDAHHSYFMGCSTGGREAMVMSQRYPSYFDGIVAGAPAMRTNYSNLGLRWITSALNGVAPKAADGKPMTSHALTPADRTLVVNGFLAACDALDGAEDGLVFATQSCRFDPAVLACKGKAKGTDCLSRAQVAAVKKIMAGPVTSEGIKPYPGYLYDTGIATSNGLPGVLTGPVIPEGPRGGDANMNVAREAAVAHDGRSMLGDTNAWTNLSTFRGRGGKLIYYHGVSDPWFSAVDTLQYYQRLAADNGAGSVADWSRLFLVPGMGHCRGGERTLDNFDMVDALVNWVEQNRAPAQIIATGASMPGISRPLCPHPQHAQYTGSGDMHSAASFRCTN